jgi:hypothetical protein
MRVLGRSLAALGAAIAAFALAGAWAGACQAQVDLISPDAIHGVVDLRVAAADGEPSFEDGGFGKSRYGGDGGASFKVTPQIANAALEWTPRFGFDVSAVIDVLAQPGQEHSVDLGQAYVVFKPVPRSATRFQLRAGLYYPPISLENDARAWGVTNTITPSAINSWIGEEVKVVGLEGKVTRDFGNQQIAATAGLFGDDDTAGTLLAYRGWALHDVLSQANGSFPLPPLAPFQSQVQDDETYSNLEIDKRVGFYGRLDWRPLPRLALNVFYYDNRGNMIGVTPDLQWAWLTTFTDVGLRWDADDRTVVLAQALWGRTVMGYPTPGGRFINMDFSSAYVLGTRTFGKSALTARLDLFDTHDNAALFLGDDNEHGWALTGAWRYPITDILDLRLEAMRIDSVRPSRALAGEAPHQAQTVLQSSLRLMF